MWQKYTEKKNKKQEKTSRMNADSAFTELNLGAVTGDVETS